MKMIWLFNFTEVAAPGCEISKQFLKEIGSPSNKGAKRSIIVYEY